LQHSHVYLPDTSLGIFDLNQSPTQMPITSALSALEVTNTQR